MANNIEYHVCIPWNMFRSSSSCSKIAPFNKYSKYESIPAPIPASWATHFEVMTSMWFPTWKDVDYELFIYFKWLTLNVILVGVCTPVLVTVSKRHQTAINWNRNYMKKISISFSKGQSSTGTGTYKRISNGFIHNLKRRSICRFLPNACFFDI